MNNKKKKQNKEEKLSYKDQMRAFIKENKNEIFTATGLARALEWGKKRGRNLNAGAARSIAKKCGAKVEKVEHEIDKEGKSVNGFNITL